VRIYAAKRSKIFEVQLKESSKFSGNLEIHAMRDASGRRSWFASKLRSRREKNLEERAGQSLVRSIGQ